LDILFIIFIFVAVLATSLYFRSPTVIGARGEARATSRLKSALNPDEYVILNDLTLPTNSGTTQIDHVIVSRFGIFVIETKNMKGWIFGGERQARWTQTLRGHKSQFQNPLRQNFKHVKTVQELLSLRAVDIHNIVVFVGSAEPKTDMPDNVLWTARELAGYVRARRMLVFSQGQVNGFVEKLRQSALEPNRATRREHVRGLRKQAVAKERDKTKCPKCGCSMSERTNKKTGGQFLGCSRFPECRGTRRHVQQA
jgi:restriction system protein